jgi:hypothetical protein
VEQVQLFAKVVDHALLAVLRFQHVSRSFMVRNAGGISITGKALLWSKARSL